MTLSQKEPIKNLTELRIHLQFAIGLELTTIPLYLSALYSIPDGDNTMASRVIQSVAIEEMLHMALAANVLNAIGGRPSTARVKGVGDPIPHFPTAVSFLPGLGVLNLVRFSRESIKTFLKVEHPDDPCDAPDNGYGSIGAFYEAIEQGIKDHCPPSVFKKAKPRQRCQIKPEDFYGGAGKLLIVKNADDALEAINEIVRQGEGVPPKVLKEKAGAHGVRPHYLATEVEEGAKVDDGDVLADGWKMYSHFARFQEILAGRRYKPTQTIRQKPSGDVLPVDWDQVYPMTANPSAAMYAGTEVAPGIAAFNLTYTRLLDELYAAFNGESPNLEEAVRIMWQLKYEGVALMKTPSPLSGDEYQQSARHLNTYANDLNSRLAAHFLKRMLI